MNRFNWYYIIITVIIIIVMVMVVMKAILPTSTAVFHNNNYNNANFYFPIHNNNLKHNATESSYGQPTLFIVPSAEQGSSSTVQSFFRNITHMIQIWQFYSFRIVFDH